MAKHHLVRWLGAFGAFRLAESVRWEMTQTDRQVSAAYAPAATVVGTAKIGLLLNQKANHIAGVFAGDCWSVPNEAGYNVYTRSVKLAENGVLVDTDDYDYNEVIIDPRKTKGLVVLGVVVHRFANKRERQRAAELAKSVGLPYLGTLK